MSTPYHPQQPQQTYLNTHDLTPSSSSASSNPSNNNGNNNNSNGFSTPQRKTPLNHHSPGLSPITSSGGKSHHMNLFTPNLQQPPLPGIAEADEQNISGSFESHLNLSPVSMMEETPIRPSLQRPPRSTPVHKQTSDHFNETLQSISLLPDQNAASPSSKLSTPKILFEKERPATQIEMEIESSQSQAHANIQQVSNNNPKPSSYPMFGFPMHVQEEKKLSVTRFENRKLIETIQSKYRSSSSSTGPAAATTNPITPRDLMNENRQSLVTEDLNVLPTSFGEKQKRISPPPASSASSPRYSQPAPAPRSQSPVFLSSNNPSTSRKSSPTNSVTAATLPIGAFFALILDSNQQPVLVPVASSPSSPPQQPSQQQPYYAGEDYQSHPIDQLRNSIPFTETIRSLPSQQGSSTMRRSNSAPSLSSLHQHHPLEAYHQEPPFDPYQTARSVHFPPNSFLDESFPQQQGQQEQRGRSHQGRNYYGDSLMSISPLRRRFAKYDTSMQQEPHQYPRHPQHQHHHHQQHQQAIKRSRGHFYDEDLSVSQHLDVSLRYLEPKVRPNLYPVGVGAMGLDETAMGLEHDHGDEIFQESYNNFYFSKLDRSAKVDHLYWNYEQNNQRMSRMNLESTAPISSSTSSSSKKLQRKLSPSPKKMRFGGTTPMKGIPFAASMAGGHVMESFDQRIHEYHLPSSSEFWKNKMVSRSFKSILSSPEFAKIL
jgi:hypothetical protein